MGLFGTDCYILGNSDNEAILIDAPEPAGEIIGALEKNGLKLKKILLTHGHCDHIESLNALYEKYRCEVYIHGGDANMLYGRELSLAGYFGTPFEKFTGKAEEISDGDIITLGDISVKTLHTPGHSAGSVTYITDERIFTGDTIFEGTVGRTDLGGSFETLLSSIKRLMEVCMQSSLPAFPGHGAPTELGFELKNNPYLEALRSKTNL